MITVNGKQIDLSDIDIPPGGFNEFVRKAEPEEVIAIIVRVREMLMLEGFSKEQVQKGVDDITYQIGVLRGTVAVH